MLAVSVSSAATRLDPLHLEALTSPDPNQPWIPDQPLPQVPAPAALRAQPADLDHPLSLAELTDLALRLNPRTRQAWLQARAEAATLGIESAAQWPQLSALVNHRIGRSVSATSGSPSPVSTNYGAYGKLELYPLRFWSEAAIVEAANYRLLAANLAQNRVLQEVVFQVEQAYYRVSGFDQLVRVSRDSLSNFETALDAAQRRRSSGLATAGDEYRAQTQVGQARLVLTRNQGELSKAYGQLANAAGVSVNSPLQLQSLAALAPVSEITQSMNALLDKPRPTVLI